MVITSSPRRHGDDGLSEVIGFIIIFGIIVILFANYMLYGIPAQGRDAEIAHMNEIKDQFVEYKIGLDSLFNNNKLSTTVSNSFTLGTGGSFSMGANSIIPIISPVRSGGTIAINQRTTVPETLTISSQSLILNTTQTTTIGFPPQQQINYTTNHVLINISGIQASDFSTSGVFGTTITGTNWRATVNITPRSDTYQNYTWHKNSGGDLCPSSSPYGPIIYLAASDCLVPSNNLNYSYSDLTITITKANISTMQGAVVYDHITPGNVYTIDLMDYAYGLTSYILPSTNISLTIDKPLGSITATGNVTYGFTEMNPYMMTPIALGALEYRSQNNYWIQQNYYYQLGGIFIAQGDGNSTYKLPPEITFSNDTARNIVTVNINALAFDPTSRGIVGGNSPVQIKTMMTGNTPMPYVTGTANTKWIQIAINTTDSQAREMWKNYFTYSAMVAGIPNYVVVRDDTNNQSYIQINGSDRLGNTYDINVIASNATFSAAVHGVGGTYA
jgi:hypothetical protein